jgi:hypothetical protein
MEVFCISRLLTVTLLADDIRPYRLYYKNHKKPAQKNPG